jgi:hypothetical protein
MAKTTGENIIFVGKDGKIVIASATGEVTVATIATLSGDLTSLLKKRQTVGKELTAALAKAKFPVAASVQAVVVDPSGALGKLTKTGKKRKKKKD